LFTMTETYTMKYPKKLEIRLTQAQYDRLQKLADVLGTPTATTARNLLTKVLTSETVEITSDTEWKTKVNTIISDQSSEYYSNV